MVIIFCWGREGGGSLVISPPCFDFSPFSSLSYSSYFFQDDSFIHASYLFLEEGEDLSDVN